MCIRDRSAQGEFQNIAIASEGYPSEEVYNKAEILHDAIESGGRQASGNYDSELSEANDNEEF